MGLLPEWTRRHGVGDAPLPTERQADTPPGGRAAPARSERRGPRRRDRLSEGEPVFERYERQTDTPGAASAEEMDWRSRRRRLWRVAPLDAVLKKSDSHAPKRENFNPGAGFTVFPIAP